jgi:hypothetical protein|tara:strand:+ start:1834 stop:1998 length:165 start_codon:yes stop_codon:yes gene_type:complete
MINRKTKFDKLKDRVREDIKAKLYQKVREPLSYNHAWIFADDRMVNRIRKTKYK